MPCPRRRSSSCAGDSGARVEDRDARHVRAGPQPGPDHPGGTVDDRAIREPAVALCRRADLAGRSPAEIREATRHEALINLAWPDAGTRVLCPYDAASLDDHVLADARRTHPGMVQDGELQAEPRLRRPDRPVRMRAPAVRSAGWGALACDSRSAISGVYERGWPSVSRESAVSRGACLRACARGQRADHEHGQACGHPRRPAVLADAGRADLSGRGLRPHRRSARGAASATAGHGRARPVDGERAVDLVEIRTSAAGTTIRAHSASPGPRASSSARARASLDESL